MRDRSPIGDALDRTESVAAFVVPDWRAPTSALVFRSCVSQSDSVPGEFYSVRAMMEMICP